MQMRGNSSFVACLMMAGVCWSGPCVTLAAEAATAGSTAVGVAPASWRCAGCAGKQGWVLDLSIAPAYVGDDAYRFGDYTGLDEQGAYLFGDVKGSYFGDYAHYFRFNGFSLSPDFTALFVEGGKQGSFQLRGSYQSIPRRFFDTTMTPFQGSGSDQLTLPERWVRAPTTSAMSALADTARPVEIKRDWDVLKLGFDIKPDSRWTIRTDYTRRERNGQDLSSGSFLFSAAELTRPVEYTTDDVELAVEFSADRWQASVGYQGSYFDNADASLLWDNPFSGFPGADTGAIALAPDSESHQLSFAGALHLPGRTVLSSQLAVGRLSQDEDLPAYTTNEMINTIPLPMRSADVEVDTLNVNLRAVSSPWRNVTLQAEYRYNEFDNRKPLNVYDYVVTDSALAEVSATSLAYDYERSDIKLRGEYRINRSLKLQLGFDTREFRRNFQEHARTTTDRLWLRLHHRLGMGADVDFDLFTEQRRGSSYDVRENPAARQNPLMRKYNLSDRERNGVRLKGSLYPDEHWDFGWEFEYGEDDYDGTTIGLTHTRYVRVGADVSWLIMTTGALFASLNTEQVQADQAASQSFDVRDWTGSSTDRFSSASIGFEQPELFGPVGMRLEYNWSRSRAETAGNTSGLAGGFPDLKSSHETASLGFSYQPRDSWTFGLNYRYEKVASDNWALDDVASNSIPNLLSLGADPFNYSVNVIYFSVRYMR